MQITPPNFALESAKDTSKKVSVSDGALTESSENFSDQVANGADSVDLAAIAGIPDQTPEPQPANSDTEPRFQNDNEDSDATGNPPRIKFESMANRLQNKGNQVLPSLKTGEPVPAQISDAALETIGAASAGISTNAPQGSHQISQTTAVVTDVVSHLPNVNPVLNKNTDRVRNDRDRLLGDRNAAVVNDPSPATRQNSPLVLAAPIVQFAASTTTQWTDLSLGADQGAPLLSLDVAERASGPGHLGAAVPNLSPTAFATAARGPMAASPTLAQSVAVQISDAVTGQGEKRIEIMLEPIELGRLRLALHPGEHGMNIHIVAERAETLDLIRRHMHLLKEEFQSLGYNDVAFDFAHDDQPAREHPDWSDDRIPADISGGKAALAQSQINRKMLGGSYLDIRL